MKKQFFKLGKNIKGIKPKKQRRKYKTYIIIVLILISCILLYTYIEGKAMPTIISMANMKIQTMATQMINESIEEVLLEKNIDTNELAIYTYNEQQEVISCGVNTVLINQICAAVIKKITEKVDVYQDEEMAIPLGNIIGDGAFSNYGPNIMIDIMPYGTANINYDRQFIQAGINQINYRIWLHIEMDMQVIVPLDSEGIKVSQEVVLVDNVITGGVPDSYVFVPEDELMNVVGN